MDRCSRIDNILKRRFFIAQTGGIYGGSAGFFDYGPIGCSLRNNIVQVWRHFFTQDMNSYEIDSSIILSENILKASGHVDKFCDVLVFDMVNGECYRADHYLKEFVSVEEAEKLDVMSLDEITNMIKKYNIKSLKGNDLSEPFQFNLMFKTFIGPKTKNVGYLRPETAQGQFLNFKKIYELNSNRLPFATFSIGKAFRNEISPRNGLLRIREFEQAEIEYFVDPEKKVHPNYKDVKNISLSLHYGPEIQVTTLMSIDDALEQKIIKNECIAYFIGKTAQFFNFIGINKYRFRQHKKDEMAHYACDCWDGEISINDSWVECIGIADRSCYDLKQHSEHSGHNLFIKRDLTTPKKIIKYEPILDLKNWGKKYKKELPLLLEKIKIETKSLDHLTQQYYLNEDGTYRGDVNELDLNKLNMNSKFEEKTPNLQKTINFNGEDINLEYQRSESVIFSEDFLPTVIEPSFGISRILQAILDQNFKERSDERVYFSFIPQIAPYHVGITSLLPRKYSEEQFSLYKSLMSEGIRTFITDQNVSIGKRYSSADEIGTSFFITFDTESQNDQKVTIRERNSMEQIRIEIVHVTETVKKLIKGAKMYDMGEKFVLVGS